MRSKQNLGTEMTRLDKFEDLNRWFISLGTGDALYSFFEAMVYVPSHLTVEKAKQGEKKHVMRVIRQ